ncbi:S1 domain-containing protein [Risungbinella massiliensis]|uniref:hypothetical protein n=1 Tax=Risungbinella massiliensis TaxID=1329796 RepID=UPI0005CC5B01|nr:hypothetical protein [Risungbinella massiliensis]
MSIDDRIADHATQIPDSMKLDTKPLHPPYKVGDTVPVRVNHIVEYGAFAHILDENGKETGYSGLIHKKNISPLFVEHVDEWTYNGHELEARIQEITREYKINLTVVHLDLKPLKEYNNPFRKLKTKNSHFPPERHESEKMEQTEYSAQEQIDTLSEVDLNTSGWVMEQEIQSIYQHLGYSLGILSPKTKKQIRKLVQEKGVFQTAVAIMEAMQDFEVDLSYHFIKEVQKKLGDGL